MKLHHIADNLSLPIDAATQTFAFIGRKGSGKSYGAGKLVELLIDAGVQVAILDTVGNWYGLRLGADGKSAGIDIPIVGGLRGDIPLEATGGALIAESLVESGRSMVIDASQFSKADRQRFAAALGEKLWRLKKAERQPTPIHLVIEESQLIVPENVRGDSAVMVGTYEEIIRLGRNYGIGITMITQRPQSVNKEVLNQTECLFVFQVNGAHERDALKKWIVHQGMDVDLLDQLPGLEIGHCFVWSPQWLRILKKIGIAPKRTFDSTSTPRVGHGTFRGKDLKAIDLVDLQAKMAASIERAKADDPRELRRQIADLKKQIAAQPANIKERIVEKIVEVPVMKNGQLAKTEKVIERTESLAQRFIDEGQKMLEEAGLLRRTIAPAFAKPAPAPPQKVIPQKPAFIPQKPKVVTKRPENIPDSGDSITDLTGPEQRILDALAWLESIGVNEPEQTAAAFLAGYTSGGGAWNNPKGKLRGKGLIEYLSGDCLRLTDDGRALAHQPEGTLTTEQLHEKVMQRLPGPERKILGVLLGAYPDDVSNADLAAASGYAQGGAFNNPKGRLRTLGLIEYPSPGRARARGILFLA